MNPINDQMPTKDSTDVQKPPELDKSTELSELSNEILEKIKTAENVHANNDHEEINEDDNVKINQSEKEKVYNNVNSIQDDGDSNTLNEKESESKVNEKESGSKVNEKASENKVNEKESENKVNERESENKVNEREPESKVNEKESGSNVNEKDIADEKDISAEIAENSKQQPDIEIDQKEVSEEIAENSKQQPDIEIDQKDVSEEIAENSKQQKDIENDSKNASVENEDNIQQPVVENDLEDNSKDISENHKKQTDVESDQKENNQKIIEKNQVAAEKSKETVTEPVSEEENEDFENMDDFEDAEEDEEEEVDEIIVPDEAEAEDLTDGKDNEHLVDKSLHEDLDDDEEGTMKGSEMEDNDLNEEENSKGSETVEKDEDSDKKSLHAPAKEDTSSKDSEGSDMVNCNALEECIKNVDSPLEAAKSNEPNIDEDTTSQATYDPLNYTGNKEQDAEHNDDTEINKNENSSDSRPQYENDDNDVHEITGDEEDDEVQFVETRNSPICIESDDDDDDGNEDIHSKDVTGSPTTANSNKNENNRRSNTTSEATVTVAKNTIVTRTSARKSTAKPQQSQLLPVKNFKKTTPQIENKSRNSSDYLPKASIQTKRTFISKSAQHIVDCIELLDSSDEESAPPRANKSAPVRKTPQKRTLLAAKGNYYKNNNSKTTTMISNRLPHNFAPQVRQQSQKPAPPPLPPPTPQSNFLNAVQLQPASVSGPNPPAFSALLSNKSVIIPNAFYGNPPSVMDSPEHEIERRYARWIENFLNQFCKPQYVPTHSCLVFLQRALKYKDFVRIKGLRNNMNSHAQNASNQLNITLMTDLKIIFFKAPKKTTNYGRRFCELTCYAVNGKSIALMAHAISGKVTLKTCNMELPKSSNSALSSTSSSSSSATNTVTRKRQLDEDEDEYTPDKSQFKPSENGDDDSSEMGDDRKRSLRTKRTKRIDNSFSYNEDDLLAEYEIDDEDDEKLAQVEIERKIEEKRLEAQKQRQQQVKSFESAFIQAFARSSDAPTTSTKSSKNASTQRIRLRNTTTATATSIQQYTANNDAEDLLQATWIENHENDETQVISDDDEPKVHRIYKQQQQEELQLQHQQQQDYYYTPPSTKLSSINKYKSNSNNKSGGGKTSKRNQEEVITGDDYEENNCYENTTPTDDPTYWPKNIDAQMYVNGKYKDRCVICNLNCQRLVHHYVNEHRGCEVYNSRLSLTQIKALKQGKCIVSEVSLYKNGQFQYEAFCIFCQKTSRFMFPYWYQHFTMHTGEYAYRCIGCGIRKPTRSLLTQHQAQGCPEVGGIAQDYAHDSKTLQIEAKICNLCNYVQLHRSNIVKHLHTQHNIKQILPKHIQTTLLLKTPASMTATPVSAPTGPAQSRRSSSRQTSMRASTAYVIDEEDNDDVSYEEILPEESQPQTNAENNYYNYIPPYMQAAFNAGHLSYEEVDAGDDLSYMICGMLDVQMNPDAN